MIRYLLDTDTCIEMIRRRPARLLERLRRRKVGSIGLSAITLAELLPWRPGLARRLVIATSEALLEI